MIRTAMLMSVLIAIMVALGFLMGGFLGMTIAFVLALLVNFLSFWFSDRMVLRMYNARPNTDPKLESIVEKMAREAGVPKPRVYVIPSDVPNAFATGRGKKNAVVAVTQGLGSLTEDEMEGVIAHEMAHIKNNDMLIQTMIATIAGTISFIAQIGYWSFFASDDRDGGSILGLLLIVVFAPIAALMVRTAISRGREYRADLTGAVVSKKPEALASALRKIHEMSAGGSLRGSAATSHLWIVNPFRRDLFTGLFSTHPPLDKRIAKLERMGGKFRDYSDR